MSASQKELREAYARGMTALGAPPDFVQTESLVAYPPKTVVRQKIVNIGGYDYWLELSGSLSRIYHSGTFIGGTSQTWLVAEDVRTLADLFANPTEEVEVDE